MKSRSDNVALCVLVFVLCAMSGIFPVVVEGSEFRILPRVSLSEEYNDNVLLTTKNRSDDYITSIAPAVSILYLAPTWEWDIAYTYRYLYYTRATLDDESTHTLQLINRSRILRDIFFLDLQDQYQRVSLDVLRDYTQESSYVNQSDRNLLTVNPYMVLTPVTQLTVTTGYIFSDTWYEDPIAIDRTDHIGYLDVRRDFSSRTAMTAGARRTWDENVIEGYTKDDLSLGFIHEYADGSTISVTAGNSWFDYETTDRTSQVFWDAILTQRWPTVTVSYETGLRFIADPQGRLRREDRYLATIRRDLERNSIVLSGGLVEYRETESKHLENARYLLTASVSHALTTRSQAILNLAVERLKDYPSGAFRDRYLAGARFEQLVMEELTLALDYRFTNVYSPEVYLDNYANNRFTVELRMAF